MYRFTIDRTAIPTRTAAPVSENRIDDARMTDTLGYARNGNQSGAGIRAVTATAKRYIGINIFSRPRWGGECAPRRAAWVVNVNGRRKDERVVS